MEFGIAILLATAIVGTLLERDGEIIRVQNPQELQKAIHEARSGDTILLEDGTYKLESSLWIENKKNLTIKGASEDPEQGTEIARHFGIFIERTCLSHLLSGIDQITELFPIISNLHLPLDTLFASGLAPKTREILTYTYPGDTNETKVYTNFDLNWHACSRPDW